MNNLIFVLLEIADLLSESAVKRNNNPEYRFKKLLSKYNLRKDNRHEGEYIIDVNGHTYRIVPPWDKDGKKDTKETTHAYYYLTHNYDKDNIHLQYSDLLKGITQKDFDILLMHEIGHLKYSSTNNGEHDGADNSHLKYHKYTIHDIPYSHSNSQNKDKKEMENFEHIQSHPARKIITTNTHDSNPVEIENDIYSLINTGSSQDDFKRANKHHYKNEKKINKHKKPYMDIKDPNTIKSIKERSREVHEIKRTLPYPNSYKENGKKLHQPSNKERIIAVIKKKDNHK